MKQILLDWKRNRHSILAVAFSLLLILLSACFSVGAQAGQICSPALSACTAQTVAMPSIHTTELPNNLGNASTTSCSVIGNWLDNYGYDWSINSISSGVLYVSGCPSSTWSTVVTLQGTTGFSLTVNNPTGGDQTCVSNFTYNLTFGTCQYASGTWTNTAGYSGYVTANLVSNATPNNLGVPDDSCPSACDGNPINSATGNKFQVETDFTGATSTGIELIRTYNSQDAIATAFGANWHDTWQRSVSLSADGTTARVNSADGGVDTFTYNSGVWIPSPNVTSTLSAVISGSTQNGWKLVTADDNTELYTANGLLSSVTNRAGNVTALAYNGSNLLTSVTGPFGHKLTFTYNVGNLIATVTLPDGGVLSYGYDANNNLTSVSYPDKTVRQYVYNESANTLGTNLPHALTGIIDELGNRYATYQYDPFGQAVSSKHAGGADQVTITYNADGSSTVKDALGNVHSYTLTTVFGMVLPTAVTGTPVPNAGGQAFTYDTKGFLASRTDWNGNVTTYTHDIRGDETSRTEASGTAQARTITTTWHSTFHLPTQITEPNRITTFTYDSHGNLTQKTITDANNSKNIRSWSYTYNANGQVTKADGPRTDVADITQYSYDAKGDLASVTDALGHVTTISAYDANGRPLTLQDPNGLITQLAYDPRGRLLSRNTGGETMTYTYDAVGQVLKITQADASFTAFTYDAAHRLTQVSDNLGNKIVYTLDANGNQTKKQVYDPSSTLTRSLSQTFDAINRLQTSVGAQGQTTTYGYDSNGNLTSVTDPLTKATTRSFDALNRLIASIDPLSGKTQYQFDANDNLAQVTDPRSANTVYTYDGLGNKTKQTSPDTGVTTYTYDAAGNIISSTDARGVQSLYSYDALNRLIKKSFTPNNSYGDISSTTYQYDQGKYGIGHLTGMTDISGTTTWLYEIHGRAVQQQQTIGLVTLTTSYQYDATGRLSQLTTPANQIIAYQYNANGQVNAVKVNGVVLFNAVQYQPFGPISSWVWGNGTAYKRSYDLDGRLTKLPLGTDNRSITYDADSRITGQTSDGTVLSVSPNFVTGANAGTTKYAIKTTGNALLSQTLPNSSVSTMGYDAVGNLLSDSFTSYQYDLGGRLINAGSNSFQVDGLGKRVAKVNLSTGNRYFAYDQAGHLLGEYNAQGLAIQETIWLGDMPVGTVSASTGLLYVYPDHLNTPRTVTTQSNRVLWSWVSDPFGNGAPLTSNDDTGKPYQYNLRFPGQYYDAETGLHYNMARYYNPVIGRYTQSDPIGLGGGINTYVYVKNSPLSMIDLKGFYEYDPWEHYRDVTVGPTPAGSSYFDISPTNVHTDTYINTDSTCFFKCLFGVVVEDIPTKIGEKTIETGIIENALVKGALKQCVTKAMPVVGQISLIVSTYEVASCHVECTKITRSEPYTYTGNGRGYGR